MLPLHMYTSNFEDMTWKAREVVVTDEQALEAQGVAALGARRMMLKTFEIVRRKMTIGDPTAPPPPPPPPGGPTRCHRPRLWGVGWHWWWAVLRRVIAPQGESGNTMENSFSFGCCDLKKAASRSPFRLFLKPFSCVAGYSMRTLCGTFANIILRAFNLVC